MILVILNRSTSHFFDHVTLRQLKDAASAVLFTEKCSSLAGMFCIELKITIDIVKLCLQN